jgi:hypothetical protein
MKMKININSNMNYASFLITKQKSYAYARHTKDVGGIWFRFESKNANLQIMFMLYTHTINKEKSRKLSDFTEYKIEGTSPFHFGHR